MESLYYYWITVLQDVDLQLSIQMMFLKEECVTPQCWWPCTGLWVEPACSSLHGNRGQEPCNSSWALLTDPLSAWHKNSHSRRQLILEKRVNILLNQYCIKAVNHSQLLAESPGAGNATHDAPKGACSSSFATLISEIPGLSKLIKHRDYGAQAS